MPSSSMISLLYDKIFELKCYCLPSGLQNAAFYKLLPLSRLPCDRVRDTR